MSETEKIVIAVLSSSLFTGLVQMLIQHFYSEKLERFKAQLQIAATERQIKQSRVFEEQTKAVAEIYDKLCKLSTSAKQLHRAIATNDFNTIKTAWKNFNTTQKDFGEYYYPKAIYIRKSTGDISLLTGVELRLIKFRFLTPCQRTFRGSRPFAGIKLFEKYSIARRMLE